MAATSTISDKSIVGVSNVGNTNNNAVKNQNKNVDFKFGSSSWLNDTAAQQSTPQQLSSVSKPQVSTWTLAENSSFNTPSTYYKSFAGAAYASGAYWTAQNLTTPKEKNKIVRYV